MAPVLRVLAGGRALSRKEILAQVIEMIDLSAEDLSELLPSGDPLVKNRVGWSIGYLKQAGLIAQPRRGIVEITDRGRSIAVKHPDRVTSVRARASSSVTPLVQPSGSASSEVPTACSSWPHIRQWRGSKSRSISWLMGQTPRASLSSAS
ncbi:winged helix-turn-helix domain-containing protein [Actinomadura napierensis]